MQDKNRPDGSNIDLSESLPKTAVIGASGFLGSAFLAAYRQVHPDCIGTARNLQRDNIFALDLRAPNIAPLRLAGTQHKEALILAGVSKVSKCETEKELSRKINIEGTLELIRQLVSEGIKPIFVSSDYVFDGNTGNYVDDSPVHPIIEYGLQKAEVEARIGEISKGNYLVIRLSKIFSLKKGDGTLLDEMASILWSGKTFRAAHDQVFCPMLISDLIRTTADLQIRGTTGIANVCSPEKWSRYDLALEMAKALGFDSGRVCRISLDEFGTNPWRPKDTSMKIERLLRETQCNFIPISKCIEHAAKNWKRRSREE